jgi:hypothetical protein
MINLHEFCQMISFYLPANELSYNATYGKIFGAYGLIFHVLGYRWAALLVAGKDTEDANRVEISKALTKDVKDLEKLLTSLAPRVFGIRFVNDLCIVHQRRVCQYISFSINTFQYQIFTRFSTKTGLFYCRSRRVGVRAGVNFWFPLNYFSLLWHDTKLCV